MNAITTLAPHQICSLNFLWSSLSIAKWAARIAQDKFDLESPNFNRTSRPTVPTASLDTTSLSTSELELIAKTHQKCNLRQLESNFSGTVESSVIIFFFVLLTLELHHKQLATSGRQQIWQECWLMPTCCYGHCMVLTERLQIWGTAHSRFGYCCSWSAIGKNVDDSVD